MANKILRIHRDTLCLQHAVHYKYVRTQQQESYVKPIGINHKYLLCHIQASLKLQQKHFALQDTGLSTSVKQVYHSHPNRKSTSAILTTNVYIYTYVCIQTAPNIYRGLQNTCNMLSEGKSRPPMVGTSCEPNPTAAYSEDLHWWMVYQLFGIGKASSQITELLNVNKATVQRKVFFGSKTFY